MQTHVGAEKHIEDSNIGSGCVIACQICCMNGSATTLPASDCKTYVKVGGVPCNCEDNKPNDPGCGIA